MNVRPNIYEAAKVNIDIKGLKLLLTCPKCNRTWSIWFRDEQDLLNNLPDNWHICSHCRDESKKLMGVTNGYNQTEITTQ